MFEFPKSRRLLVASDYTRVLKSNEPAYKSVGKRLVVYAVPSYAGQSRVGLIVSRKVGGAVQRNRVKRIIREVFRQSIVASEEANDALADCVGNSRMDYVVIARPSASSASYDELDASLRAAFRQLDRSYLQSSQEEKKSG